MPFISRKQQPVQLCRLSWNTQAFQNKELVTYYIKVTRRKTVEVGLNLPLQLLINTYHTAELCGSCISSGKSRKFIFWWHSYGRPCYRREPINIWKSVSISWLYCRMMKRYIIRQRVATDTDIWPHKCGFLCYLCCYWWRWTTYIAPVEWRHTVLHIEQKLYLGSFIKLNK